MQRVVMLCAAIVAALTAGSHGQTDPSSDPSNRERLLETTTIGGGAAIRINDAGQVLVLTGADAPGSDAVSTHIWTRQTGSREIRFEGTTAATRGTALSNSGYVVGQAVSPRGTYEGFIWSERMGIRLVSTDPVMDDATVAAVNDDGENVGNDGSSHSAYRASADGVARRHPLGSSSVRCASNATAISHWGESIGASTVDPTACTGGVNPAMHAYLLQRDGTATDLGTLGGARSQALAVNDRGQVVGWSESSTGTRHAFLWSAATGMRDLGTLGGATSRAVAVNNNGEVVGVSETASGEQRAFAWSPREGMRDIGPGVPSAINDLGQVAGTTGAGNAIAYLWSPVDGYHVLARDARALDINDRGQIAGATITPAGFEQATVWQVSTKGAERISWYEARTAALLFGRAITPQQAAEYGRLTTDARAWLAQTSDAGALTRLLTRLTKDLGEPGTPLPSDGGVPVGADAPSGTPAGGAIYNLKVVTDASPDLSDLESFVNSTTSRWPSAAEKVWALFYWSHLLKRQTPPMIQHGWEVVDPIRNLTDYGFTQCSTISGINQSLYDALGLRHQFWDICQHTVSAVEYDGSFHLVDSSMSNLVAKDDGVTLASVPEAAADSARLVRQHSLYSTSPEGFLTGSDYARNLSDFPAPDGSGTLTGYSRDFCANNLNLRNYYNWESGHRYILNLRDHESYTRFYRRLGSTQEYWVGSEYSDDPSQTWEIDSQNRFGLRGNGAWSFTPDLSAAGYAQAAYRTTNITPAAIGGLQPSAPSVTADAIYKVQAADVIASQTVNAQFSRTDPSAAAVIAISLNHGLTWVQVADVGSGIGSAIPVTAHLRNEANGAYETLIRVQMTAGSTSAAGITLTALSIDTITQVNAKALPTLDFGRNEIYVGAGEQSDSMVLWPDLRRNLWQKDVYASSNIGAQAPPVTGYSAVAYPLDLTQPAHLTYRMDAPTDITRVVYGGRLYNRVAGSSIEFLHSFDNGTTWTRTYQLTGTSAPYDVIHYETVTDIPAGVRTVLFRFQIHGSASDAVHPSGLYSVRMEADHKPAAGGSRPIDVTFRWKEVRPDRTLVDRSHKQRINAFPFTYTIDVGGSDHPVMESLTVHVEGAGDGTPYGYGDGVDVGGQKYVHARRTDGTNLAQGRPYSFTRDPSGFQSSAGTTNHTVLTDGVVGAPASGGTAYWWGQCWNPGAAFDIDVDLGQPQSVSAFRAHLFGYPFTDALRGDVSDSVEILTSTDDAAFVSQGQMPMSVWKKDIPINYMLQDDETATGWNFEHRLTQGVDARYVRYRMTPNRILCASELQVFDRIDYQPFDLRIALPDGVTPPTDTVPPSVTITAPLPGATVSGVVTLSAAATDNVAVTRVDFMIDGVLVASDTTAPYSGVWESSTIANGTYLVSARAADAAGNTGASIPISITVTNAIPATQLPGTIQAEDFDSGGEGVAYHDTSPGNSGGVYRNTDVDIEATTDTGGGYNVGWIHAGEWLRYMVDVSTAGTYTVAVRVASIGSGGSLHLEANGVNVTGPLFIPDTGAWQAWTTVTKSNVALASGVQQLRVVMDSDASSGAVGNVNWLRVSATGGSIPFTGTPIDLPGTFQAEDFDEGGTEVAYHDTSTGNSGGLYRITDVDIQATSDAGGGYNVGWVSAGEWLNYSVNVATAGTYIVDVRVASLAAGGTFHVEANGMDVTGPLTIPNTGNWQAWTTVTKSGVVLTGGLQALRLVMDADGVTGSVGNFNWVRVRPVTTGSTPFNGTPFGLPGTFEAEDFDDGGAGVAYHDTSSGNSGGVYRTTDVDIQGTSDSGGGYNVGWVSAGEWLNYSVNVATAGTYTIDVRVASLAAGGAFHVEANGMDVTGSLTVPNTGNWQAWTTVTRDLVSLPAGRQVLRLVMDTDGVTGSVGNFNWIRVTPTTTGSTPFNGTPFDLPGTFEAEDFDNGGADVAYHDTSPGNSGGMYRGTDVDIQAAFDSGGGYNVGWVSAGEWLNYTVNVQMAGSYTIEIRVASPGPGGTYHIEANGVDVTGTLVVPDTGNWQVWTTVARTNVSLAAGRQVLRLVMDSVGTSGDVANFNWIAVRPIP